jgi:hypothetical protein
MRPVPCVVSVAEHTGWAHLVCVAAHGNLPAVIARRRVALIDQGQPTMPYEHDTTAMREDEANAVIARVRRSIASRTSEALRRVMIELSTRTYCRRPRDSGAPVRRPSRNSRRCADVASSALRRGWHAFRAYDGATVRSRTVLAHWVMTGGGQVTSASIPSVESLPIKALAFTYPPEGTNRIGLFGRVGRTVRETDAPSADGSNC